MHELTHIEKNDAFLKIFVEILNGINWFNPFFYKIKKGYCFWTEADCDETLNQDFDEETRKLYANLLIKVAEINVKYKSYAASFLALKKTNSIKRRAELIMKNKKKGTKFATVAMSFMALCVFCGAGYAAKEADYAVYGVFGEEKKINNSEAPMITMLDETDIDSSEFYDVISIDDSTILSDAGESDTKHIHDWNDKKVKEHILNSDGSCDVTYYYADECSICGKVMFGDVYKTEHYVKCPH